ncbi:MAG: hypothetical protein WBW44_12595 [Solirubrobacterales bacterium]
MKKTVSWVSGSLLLLLVAAGFSATPAAASPADPNSFPPFVAGQQAEQQWPEEFAGVWISYVTPPDYDSDGLPADARFNFAFTDDAESKVEELRVAYPSSHLYVAHQHQFSKKQLYAAQTEAVADMRSHAEGTLAIPGPDFEWYGAGTYLIQNRVEVHVSSVSTQLEQWGLDRYGPMVVFQESLPIVPLAGLLPPSESGTGNVASGKRTKRKLKVLVRKCNKAGKRRSLTKKRFAKSKKCKQARRALRAARA